MSGKVKVVADYSSEDEEEETIVHKMRSTVYNKAYERSKRNKRIDPRPDRHAGSGESSSDEDSSRKYSKSSRKDHELYDDESRRTEARLEKYSDSSDYDKKNNRRKTQKNNYESKGSSHENRDAPEGRHRYDSNNSSRNRVELEKRKHMQDESGERRKEDRSGYHDDYDYGRDIRHPEEHNDRRRERRGSKRDSKTETLKNRYDNNHERRRRKEQSNSRTGRQRTQSDSNSDIERKENSYFQEADYHSDSDESNLSQGEKGSKHIIYERKHNQHMQKYSDQSDDGKHRSRPMKGRRYETLDKSKKERRENENSSQERRKHQDDDYFLKTNDKQLLEKTRCQQKDGIDNERAEYIGRNVHESTYQHDYENNNSRRYKDKDEFQNHGKEKRKKKGNTEPARKSKRENSESSDTEKARNRIELSSDRCSRDNDDKNYRNSQNKHQQNSDSESEREDGEKRSISQHRVERDLRKGDRHKQQKNKYRDEDSSLEIQHRGELAESETIENKKNNRQFESGSKITEESSKSDKKDAVAERNDDIFTRTGGAYIPPAKLRAMQAKITDKSSISYQRIAWEALKKSINGLINKVNVSNLEIIVRELMKENLVRAKGILARSIMQAQAASPTFTHVYAAVVAVINTKFPHIGELIIKRLIIQFRRSFRRNDKEVCLACTNFIAHLVNQQVAHEVLALEILTLLLENPTDHSIELAVGFLKECGARLTDSARRGIDAIFERLRTILHDGEVDKRVQYMIEVMFAVRKDKFKDHPTVISDLDVIEEEDQFTHLITLEDAVNPEDILNVFKFDPEYEANEAKYEEIKKALLESSDSGEDNSGDDSNTDDEDDEDNENESQTIIDNTDTNLTSLRRTIYLTIQSSLDFEECAHKLLKLELKPGQIVELCYMILDCCAQQRTYEKFFGLLAQRFCQINKIYVEPFEEIFKTAYDTIHRFETNKLRNVARFFAHLFYTDAISWQILSHIKLNEDDTTSSSRIFVKILFQELSEYMGLLKLNERVKDPTMQEAFEGLFPRDSPRNTRFAINFFTSIGLGGLTDELREHLKNMPKATPFPLGASLAVNEENNDNPGSSDDSEKSNVEDSNSNDSSSSEEEPRSKKSKRAKKKKKRKTHSKNLKKKKKK